MEIVYNFRANIQNSSVAISVNPVNNKKNIFPGSGSNCDIVLHSSTSRNGSIQSPLFPGPYPSRTLCRFEFQGNGRQRVQVNEYIFADVCLRVLN